MKYSITIFAIFAVLFVSCSSQPSASGKETAVSSSGTEAPSPQAAATPVQNSVDLPSLARLYAGRFDIGVCISPDQMNGPEADLIIRHFSSITAENAMKPVYLAPYEDVYYFKYADEIVEFAEVHNMHIRGHTLVWHEQNAAWMFKDNAGAPVSKDMLLKRMRDYIKTVVGRYKGRVYAWDVVNEVVNAFGFRRSDWFDIAGEEFIAEAFRTAHEADPEALLFINEFDTTERLKQNMLYKLIQRLLEAKVPVHGIGLQYHISLDYPSLQDMKKELDVFSSLGLVIHITELDMSLNSDQNLETVTAPENLLIRQAHRYKEIFDLFSKYDCIKSVTFWGLHDGRSWLTYWPIVKPDWPLLFDKNLGAKLAYWALVDPAQLPPDVVIARKTNNKIGYAPRGTPVIDGEVDEIWKTAEGMNIDYYLAGKGSTGVGRALWDDTNLYVLVQVNEATLSNKSKNAYEQDSVEIFIDEKNNKSSSYEEDDAQYRLNFENFFSSRGNPAKFSSATKVVEGGYVVEVAIPFRFVKPKAGIVIGFDLQVNDDGGAGTRTSYAKWNDPTNESFRNTSGFGRLVLIE